MTLASLAVMLFLVPQAPAKGALDGIVVNATTSEPVNGAQVMLIEIPAGVPLGGGLVGGTLVGILGASPAPPSAVATPAPNRPPAPAMVTTASDGRFAFKDLNAGTYRVMVVANGYARQEYGQRIVNGQGTPVYLSTGHELRDLTIRLSPTGAVSGRILDESGQAAVDAPVQLLRVVYNPQGKTYQALGSAAANDRGEHRLYGIPPGNYYLNVGNGPGLLRRPGQAGFGNPGSIATYAVSFYPGVADLSQAALIEVKSGGEIIADMRVERQRMYRVRGRIIDSRTGQPPTMADVSLSYRSLSGGGGSFSSGPSYDPASGAFELQNVIPGQYIIQAQIPETNPFVRPTDAAAFAARAAAVAARPSAQVPLSVTNADIEGLLLTITVPASVSGRVTLEGSALSALPNIDRIRVTFRASQDGFANPAGTQPTGSPVTADGTFQVEGLREGTYLASILGIPPGFYVKSARLDGTDILSDVFKFSGSASGRLDIVVSSGAAQINGAVTNAKGLPVPGVQAILVPVQRNRPDLYRMADTDQNGRFTMTGITPGEYRLFSWEAIEPYRYLDPDFLKRFESDGRAIHIAESSTQTIDTKMIPSARQ